MQYSCDYAYLPKIGLLGGTGDLGQALAVNLYKGFNEILVGSRNIEKAESAVKDMNSDKKNHDLERMLTPATNELVVEESDVIIVTIPHENAVETVRSLVNKFRGNQLLISAVAPVVKEGNEFRFAMPTQSSSISEAISQLVMNTVEVATAFQTIPARVLYSGREISADVLICAPEKTYSRVADIVNQINGLRPLYVGSLRLAAEIESLTALLLNIALRNHMKTPTFKLNSF